MDLKKAVTRLASFASKEHPWIRMVPATPSRGAYAYTTTGSVGMLIHLDPTALVPEDVTVSAEAASASVKLLDKSGLFCFRNAPTGPSGRLAKLELATMQGGSEQMFIPAATPTEAGGLPKWSMQPVKPLLVDDAFSRCAKFANSVVAVPGFDFVRADKLGFLACDGMRLCRFDAEGIVDDTVLIPKVLGKSWPKASDIHFCFDKSIGVASFVSGDEVRFGACVDHRIWPDLAPTFQPEPVGVLVEHVPVMLFKQATKFAIVASGTSGLIELVFTQTNIAASGILSDDARRSMHDVPVVGPQGLNVRQVFSGRLLWETLNTVTSETCELVVGSGTQALGIVDGPFTVQVIPQWRRQ